MDILKEKIKRLPEDFVVEEVLNLETTGGPYSYYRLWKKNRNTLDVLSEISSRLKIPLNRFGFSGLKDKRAVTVQHISIEGGPKRNLKGKGWSLTFLGRGKRGISIGDAAGNRFIITIKDVDAARIAHNLAFIAEHGFANYFGEQRFLSDANTKRPIALYLMEGDYQGALREYFTQSANPFLKKRLRKLWGKWDLFLLEAKHLSHQEKNAIRVLKRTKDHHKAFRALPKNLKLMFLFSYQSLLWNRVLSSIVARGPHVKVPFVRGERLAFYTKTSDAVELLKNAEIPYVSEEALESGPFCNEIRRVIEKEGLGDRLNAEVSGLLVFTPGKRRAVVRPEGLEILEQKKRRITVRFFLPSGSYATVLIRKALFLPG